MSGGWINELFSRTGDGVLWALKTVYYGQEEASGTEGAIAYGALDDHRLIDFELTEDDDE